MTSTLSATIALEVGSLTIISWLGSAYLIALAAVQPLSGKQQTFLGVDLVYWSTRSCLLLVTPSAA